MKNNFRILSMICLALVVIFATSAFTTSGPQDDKIVFGGSYVLPEDETLTGNLVVLGGVVTLEKGSTVNGDAALFGGTLDADGTIKGNMTVVGGVASLGENAIINQDVFIIGGTLNRSEGSQISGDVNNITVAPFSLDVPNNSIGPNIGPNIPFDTQYLSPRTFVMKVIYFFGMVVFMSALAMLIALLWAKPTQRVANAIRMNPIGTGGFGCLTLIVAPGLLVLVAITIILSPLSILGALLLAAAVLFGWAAMNLEVGNRLARLFKVTWSEPVAAGIGALVFNLIIFALAMVPCLGGVLVSLALLFALGGVLITRFGTHDYPERPAAQPIVATPAISPSRPVAVQSAPSYTEVTKPATSQIAAKPAAKPAAKAKVTKTTPKSTPAAKPAAKKPAGTNKPK
jgi:hypothetical protein